MEEFDQNKSYMSKNQRDNNNAYLYSTDDADKMQRINDQLKTKVPMLLG